jgi:CubicO group peptidase (beta-lactamase class C family)
VTARSEAGVIHSFLAKRIAEGRMPGAVWWVEGPDGPADHGAVGNSSVEPAKAPLAEETPFDLASLTKPLCTALILVLLEQDRSLDLSSPAGSFLDELRGSAAGEASLLSLATHTAALPAWRPLYLHSSTVEGYLARIAEQPLTGHPGGVQYSDLGYIVLGAVLERVTGLSLDRLFEERIAGPLALARCGFAAGPDRFADAAAAERGNEYEREMAGNAGKGFAWRSSVIRGEPHDGNAWALGGVAGHAGLFGAAAGVVAIAREMLRPGALALGPAARGRLLAAAPGSADRTVGFVTAAGSSAVRGLLPAEAPGHTGFTGTSLWLDPDGGRIFVLLTNRVHPTVPRRDFRTVRRGFHRLAARLV